MSEYPPPMTEDQLNMISDHTERAAKKALRNYVRGAVVGFAVLLLGIGLALSQTAGLSDLDKRTLLACERIQIVRAQSNIDSSIIFTILSSAGIREAKLARLARDKSEEDLHRKSADSFFHEANRTTVTELTDCEAAQDPDYQYPRAVLVGNPHTGKIYPVAERAIAASEALVLATENTG